jgi:hypothetical protein
MKIKDWTILALILVVAVGIYSIAYERGVTKQLRKELDQKATETEEAIKLKDSEIEDLWDNIRKRDEQLLAVNDRLDELDEDRERWKEDAIYWKNKAEEAPPEELIADIREILGTDEVWQTEDGVLFSMNAFRQVSLKLYDWKDFTERREPNYIESLDLYKTKVYVLTSDIQDMKLIMQGWEQKFNLLQDFNEDLKTYLEKRDAGSFWKSVKQVGTGIAIGALTAFVIKDVVK